MATIRRVSDLASDDRARLYRQLLGDWTTAPPTEDGYYFAKREPKAYSQDVEIVRVTELDIKTKTDLCWVARADCLEKVQSFTHWLGPLPAPEPPEKG